MLRNLLAGILLLGVASALSGFGIVETGRSFDVELRGTDVARMAGDPDGSGRAHLEVSPARQEIAWVLTVTAIDSVTGAHLHSGLPGQHGPVVASFQSPRGGASAGTLHVSRAQALDILRHPRGYYVNVQTAEFPDGALRGPLER